MTGITFKLLYSFDPTTIWEKVQIHSVEIRNVFRIFKVESQIVKIFKTKSLKLKNSLTDKCKAVLACPYGILVFKLKLVKLKTSLLEKKSEPTIVYIH